MSPNGRESLSLHFIVDKKNNYHPTVDASDRYFAQFLILGDRRPYIVQIIVTHERKILKGEQVTYAAVGRNKKIAKDLATKLGEALIKGREDSNIIDDFRVF